MRVGAIIGLGFVLLFQPTSQAQETKELASARLEFLLEQADDLMVTTDDGADAKVTRRPEPLLKFLNPLYEEQADGVLLIWLRGDRPVFLGSYSIRNEKEVFRELSVVSPIAIECRRGGRVAWAPTATDYQSRSLSEAPEPAATERLRLLQMRNLLRRFKVGNMRLMPAPLYRYSALEDGVLDGALFAFTDSNDPEIVVSICARQRTGMPPHWEYGVSRMNSSALTVMLDDQPVWSALGYWDHPRSPNDPYAEQWDANLPDELKLSAKK